MRKFLIVCFLTATVIGLSACTAAEPPPLKSPCVGAKGSPCDKRPANPDLMMTNPELFKTQA